MKSSQKNVQQCLHDLENTIKDRYQKGKSKIYEKAYSIYNNKILNQNIKRTYNNLIEKTKNNSGIKVGIHVKS